MYMDGIPPPMLPNDDGGTHLILLNLLLNTPFLSFSTSYEHFVTLISIKLLS